MERPYRGTRGQAQEWRGEEGIWREETGLKPPVRFWTRMLLWVEAR